MRDANDFGKVVYLPGCSPKDKGIKTQDKNLVDALKEHDEKLKKRLIQELKDFGC